jgi:hypothetical protein
MCVVLRLVLKRKNGLKSSDSDCYWPSMCLHCWCGTLGVCCVGLLVLGCCSDGAGRCNMPENQPLQGKRKREQLKESKEKKKQRMRVSRASQPVARYLAADSSVRSDMFVGARVEHSAKGAASNDTRREQQAAKRTVEAAKRAGTAAGAKARRAAQQVSSLTHRIHCCCDWALCARCVVC